MRLRNYFVIGVVCAVLLVAWVAVAGETMVLSTRGFGNVLFVLPDGFPNLLTTPGLKHYDMPTSIISVLRLETIECDYNVWVKEHEPIPLGLTIVHKDGNKYWVYPYATPNHSGVPKAVSANEFTLFMEIAGGSEREV